MILNPAAKCPTSLVSSSLFVLERYYNTLVAVLRDAFTRQNRFAISNREKFQRITTQVCRNEGSTFSHPKSSLARGFRQGTRVTRFATTNPLAVATERKGSTALTQKEII